MLLPRADHVAKRRRRNHPCAAAVVTGSYHTIGRLSVLVSGFTDGGFSLVHTTFEVVLGCYKMVPVRRTMTSKTDLGYDDDDH